MQVTGRSRPISNGSPRHPLPPETDRPNGVGLEYCSCWLHSTYSRRNKSIPLSGFVLAPRKSTRKNHKAGAPSWISCSLRMALQRTPTIQHLFLSRSMKHVSSASNTLWTQVCPSADSKQFAPHATSFGDCCLSAMSSVQNSVPQFAQHGKSSRPKHSETSWLKCTC